MKPLKYERLTLVVDLIDLPTVYICHTYDEAQKQVCLSDAPVEIRITPETLTKIQSGEISCITI